MIRVEQLTDEDAARWDAFVEQCPAANFFHRAGWKTIVERAFSRPTHFLYAERNGEIEGVLPIGHIKSRLFGNALISTPYCVYGGIAASSQEASQALEQAAFKLADDLRVEYLELRHTTARESTLPKKELYVTFKKEIDADPDVNMQGIPRKQRAMVRKGIKAGLVGETDVDLDRFYAMYSESVRNLGTPVMPLNWFKLIKEVFGDACEILTINKDGRAVSSVMSFYFRDEVLPYYGGGTAEARQHKANDFMYWELMRTAGERGVRTFDYGRSKQGTGSYSFKKNWGFQPTPLPYEYYLVTAKSVPDINPLNPKYRLLINLWQRMPVPVSRFVGPMIAKHLA